MTIVARPDAAQRRSHRKSPATGREAAPTAGGLYAADFYSWTFEQADKLRSGQAKFADLANIAEEIESLGRSEAAALESAYRLICLHLLKMIHQPERMTRSWYITVGRERINIARILRINPGLKPKRTELFASAYADGRKEAALETGLPIGTLPIASPFELADAEAEDVWPIDVSKVKAKRPARRRTPDPKSDRT